MVLVGRVLSITSRCLRFLTTSSTCSNPLFLKLLQGSTSNIKPTLDCEAENQDSLIWEPLLTSLKSSSPQKAQLVLEWKLEKLLKENERDQCRYSELIYICGRVRNVQFALKVFTVMEGQGVRPTSVVFNSLISVCLSSDNIITALSLFEIMQRSEDCKPNSETYNMFISTYSKLGDIAAMQVWYSASKIVGFLPTVRTFEYLITGSSKTQEFDSADKFYEEMLQLGIAPNMCMLQNMLDNTCQKKQYSKVNEFLKFVLDGGLKLSGQMAKKLMEIYSEVWKVEEMEELLLIVTRTNQDLGVLSQVHCGIIRMYALSDRLDDLEFSVGRMLEQGISFTCPDDVEKAICSYFRCAAYERLELFLERIRGSYRLTRSAYDLLVAGYRRAGMSEKLDLVVKEMILAGL
ncbi:hypothetical protein IFM89_018293 [Coptis chinensis]|uniref:PROP1-like PPR domain-containing protein n=1 Tax=Coptis chinensis TaxID=261450 RepID=A0A835M594_9MAGN|nr:hypothetical protein IFM89_018293 [Coptis chinensis]